MATKLSEEQGKLEKYTDNPVDLEKIARGVRLILEGIGENPARPGLQDTPRRVAEMYAELSSANIISPPLSANVTSLTFPRMGVFWESQSWLDWPRPFRAACNCRSALRQTLLTHSSKV